jgi:hypothetical protein
VNTSPEPFSNMAVSSVEDVVTFAGLGLALAYPGVALVAAVVLIGICVLIVVASWRLIAKTWRWIAPG